MFLLLTAEAALVSQRAVFYLLQKVVYNKSNRDPNEYYEFEDRAYVNPTLSRDEQMGFVDTLRDTVGRNTAQINAQTRALGSDLPSTQGGLTGSNSYFAQRYQTTPVETQVNTLKATAQSKALNDLMTNYQTQAQNRYNQAYRNYTKRNSNNNKTTTSTDDESPFTKSSFENGNTTGTAMGPVTMDTAGEPGNTMVDDDGHAVKYDDAGHIIETSNPKYVQADNGYYYDISDVDAPFRIQIRMPSTEMLNRWKANQKAASKGDM